MNSGLFFNKFTDSCDYATNVICKTSTTTTAKPLLTTTSTSTTTTTTTPKPTTARTTKPRLSSAISRTTTTPEPDLTDADEDAVDEDGAESPEELQQLLQLISDLGQLILFRNLRNHNSIEESSLTTNQTLSLSHSLGSLQEASMR